MNLLKSLSVQDFISQKNESGEVEVLVKMLYEPSYHYNAPDGRNQYVCIRKDFLLMLNDMFNDTEKKMNKYKEIVDKMKNVMEELNEQ